MSPEKYAKFANRSQSVKEIIKPTIKVGDEVEAKKCPFGKPYSRPALVKEVHSDHLIVVYMSTKGASCDDVVRKPYTCKNGRQVVLTGDPRKLLFSELK